MSLEKLIQYAITGAQQDLRDRLEEKGKTDPKAPCYFTITKPAGELVDPAKKCAAFHGEREKHWTAELKKVEADLRKHGVSVEALTAGGDMVPMDYVTSGNVRNFTGTATLTPTIDQKKLGAVKHAKAKVKEHSERKLEFEKYVRAFALDPKKPVLLTIDDIHKFRLEAG